MTGRSGVGCRVWGVGCRVSFGRRPYTLHPTPYTPTFLVLALLVLLVPPAGANNAVALLRRGVRAERTACYSGVKLIWAHCPGDAQHPPDYQRSARIWHDGPGRT